MQPGLVNTHDLFIGIVSALMLSILTLLLKAVAPVVSVESAVFLLILSCSNVCAGVLLHLTHI